MKKTLSCILVIMICMISVAAFTDTIFCPYCGKQIDTEYAFCPFCGKDVSSVTKQSQTQSQPSAPSSSSKDVYYEFHMIPGFHHSYVELLSICDTLYYEACQMGSNIFEKTLYKESSFPISFVVPMDTQDIVSALGLPNVRKRYYETGRYTLESRYDPNQLKWLKEDEEFTGDARFYYSYMPVQPDLDQWFNEMVFQLPASRDGVTLISFSAMEKSSWQKYELMLCSNYDSRIVTYDIMPNGDVRLSVTN